jgi:hypothetical protein
MRPMRCLPPMLAMLLLLAGVHARAAIDQETQRGLIDTTVAGFDLTPDARGRVFFLGFAGFGAERVFAEEVKLAAQRVGARYGSASRTLLLVNDRRDLETLPFATHDNLRHALQSLARVMDAERDVLFLVLSSHGDRNAMIEVSNTNIEPVGLSTTTLARLLTQSGIRHQVIVVSACFSGAFIEPLANNQSIVLTAASRTRTSFGCSDDRHFTYFGEALFRDALPRARSLREAFDVTRREIRRRERAEGATQSHPQSYFGPLMETRLAELEPAAAGAAYGR